MIRFEIPEIYVDKRLLSDCIRQTQGCRETAISVASVLAPLIRIYWDSSWQYHSKHFSGGGGMKSYCSNQRESWLLI